MTRRVRGGTLSLMRRAVAILALTLPTRALAEPGARHDGDGRERGAATAPRAAHDAAPTDGTRARPALRAECGTHDARLAAAALALLAGDGPLSDAHVAARAREAGVEIPWPRAVRIRARDDSERSRASLARAVSAFAEAAPHRGELRCGVAVARGPRGELHAAAVVVDALVQLVAPLPARAATGSVLSLTVRSLARATPTSVFAATGDAPPISVPLSRSGELWEARVPLRAAGPTSIQVVGDAGGGPRPLLEARVESWGGAPTSSPGGAVSGVASVDDRERSLSVAVHRARWHAQLPPLAEDRELDRIARAHAERMQRAATVAHDLGEGDPEERTTAAGVDVDGVGEDVAAAATLADAYRSLWESPSHRANILSPIWRRLGVGVRRDASGRQVYVALLFAR